MHTKPQLVLGFDFGMKYIGVASGQTVTKTASPITSLNATDGIPNWDEISNLIATWKPDQLIVGQPLNMDGSMQEITHCAIKFANRLRHKYKLPVNLVDERLSTWEAKQRLQTQAKSKSDIKIINAQAAVIIVEQWLADI